MGVRLQGLMVAVVIFSQNFYSLASDEQDSQNANEEGGLSPAQKQYFFDAQNNIFCKNVDSKTGVRGKSECDYPVGLAYQYFAGKRQNAPIQELTFQNKKELEEWAKQQKNTYLIAYKPFCIPCANLLAALETRVASLQTLGKSVVMVNVRKNQQAFNDEQDCWYYEGTPEVWLIRNGEVVKTLRNCTSEAYFKEFIQVK